MSTEFARENDEIPAALARMVGYYHGEGRASLVDLRRLARGRSLLFSGMGTSEITPHHVLWRLRALGFACDTVDAGEWDHHGSAPRDTELVILSSQSGESVELRNLVDHHLRGKPYVAVTNDPTSTLARSAALTLPLRAGREASITTKTYTNNLGLLDLVHAVLEDTASLDPCLRRLEECARLMETLDAEGVRGGAARLREATAVAFVGRGPSMVSARQAALTFMEGTRRLSSVYTGGAFNHGPLEAVEAGFGAVVFAPRGPTESLAIRQVNRLAGLGASVVALTDGTAAMEGAALRIRLPQGPDTLGAWTFPLLAARAHNLLVHEVALLDSHEAGRFRYGGKVTQSE